MHLEFIKSPTARWLGKTAIGYTIFFCISIWLPLGLHRLVLRQPGWWHYPTAWSIIFISVVGYSHHYSLWWALFALPYALLLFTDFWTIWAWHWPYSWTIEEKLNDLNQRYKISMHLTMGFILFVTFLIWWK